MARKLCVPRVSLLTRAERREIFAFIAQCQDEGDSVEESYTAAMAEYRIDLVICRWIVDEGVEYDWPMEMAT